MNRDEILETRRQRLLLIKSTECDGRNVVLAEKIGKSDSYVSRMLLPANKPQSKSIGEGTARAIEKTFNKPVYWLDGLDTIGEPTPFIAANKLAELAGFDIGEAFDDPGYCIPVVGELMLGLDGEIDYLVEKNGFVIAYSKDPDAYALVVTGDTLWPRINSGEFIIVEPNTNIHSGDEVFVKTDDNTIMIRMAGINRDGSYQLMSVTRDQKPVTLQKDKVKVIHPISAIIKPYLYIIDGKKLHE